MSGDDSALGYPFDETGVSPRNRVVNEPHTVNEKRIFVLDHGPFFANSVKVYDMGENGRRLTEDEFKPRYLYQRWTYQVGQAVFAYLELTNPMVSSDVRVDYQVLGGPASYSGALIFDLIEKLEGESVPVNYWDIGGRPKRFRPDLHLHDARHDIYGMEYIRDALEELLKAIQIGREAPHDAIRDWHKRMRDEFDDRVQEWIDLFYLHIRNTNNPHKLTKLQVELEQVMNWPVATVPEARSGAPQNRYLTPYLMGLILGDHRKSDDHDDRYYPKPVADDRYTKKGEVITVTLDGPRSIPRGQSADYLITNYDRYTSYLAGSVGRLTTSLIRHPNGDKLGTDGIRVSVPSNHPVGSATFYLTTDTIPRTFTINVT